MFVLVRDDGKYVAEPGSVKAYTRSLIAARKFKTEIEAERERCPENESVVPVERIMGR